MKNTTRALRRYHKNRMKKKAKKVYHFNDPEKAIKWADHLKISSDCECCCNPRKNGQKTRQEIKNSLDFFLRSDIL